MFYTTFGGFSCILEVRNIYPIKMKTQPFQLEMRLNQVVYQNSIFMHTTARFMLGILT
jgi:hypothetical protein